MRDSELVLVVMLIFAVAIAGGFLAAKRWLPPLEAGRVGDISFLVVCGLVAVAVAVLALHGWETIQESNLDLTFPGGGNGGGYPDTADIVAQGLIAALRDAGPIIGLAAAVYLLAPAGEE